jgi:thiol-disulfide isomerase/thioredoxin
MCQGEEDHQMGRYAAPRWNLLCLLATALLAVGSAGAKDLKAGDLPPDRLGTSSTGEHVKLDDYRGKVVVVTFWASWCTPCRKELPLLAGIQLQATTSRLQVFAVNLGESPERYRQIVTVLKPALKDAPMKLISDWNLFYGRQYGVKGIPHMVIIGRDGRIAAVHTGYGEGQIPALVAELNGLLAQQTEAPAPCATAGTC